KTLLGAQLRPGPGDRGQEVAGLLRQGFVVVEPGAARRRDGRSDDRAKQVAAAAHDDIVVRRVHREIAGAPAAQVPLRGLDRRATRPEAEHRRQTAGVAYAGAADCVTVPVTPPVPVAVPTAATSPFTTLEPLLSTTLPFVARLPVLSAVAALYGARLEL